MKWSFRGQRIISATIKTLIQQQGLGKLPGTRLLFGGCSAGSRGAMFNLDLIPALVPATVQVLGFLDSPLWVDELPMVLPACVKNPSNCIVPLENETKAVFQLINATGNPVLGPGCISAYPNAQWKCLYGQVRAPRTSKSCALPRPSPRMAPLTRRALF